MPIRSEEMATVTDWEVDYSHDYQPDTSCRKDD